MTDASPSSAPGLIGRAWAVVFARAGVYRRADRCRSGRPRRARRPYPRLAEDMRAAGLVEDPASIAARVGGRPRLAEALDGAWYVQECGPEDPRHQA
jgi:L-gulonate 3-dehydrogenase